MIVYCLDIIYNYIEYLCSNRFSIQNIYYDGSYRLTLSNQYTV